MKQDAPDHPKIIELAQTLGVRMYAARGLAESLWKFAAKYAKQGDVGRRSDAVIAKFIDWPFEDIGTLLNAFVSVRLLDRHEAYRLVVHNWPKHCEDAVHLSLARDRLYFADGSMPKLKRLSIKEREPIEADYRRMEEESCGHKKRTDLWPQKTHYHTTPSPSSPSHATPMPEDGADWFGATEDEEPRAAAPSLEPCQEVVDAWYDDWYGDHVGRTAAGDVAFASEVLRDVPLAAVKAIWLKRLLRLVKSKWPECKRFVGAQEYWPEILAQYRAEMQRQLEQAQRKAKEAEANLIGARLELNRQRWRHEWNRLDEDARRRRMEAVRARNAGFTHAEPLVEMIAIDQLGEEIDADATVMATATSERGPP